MNLTSKRMLQFVMMWVGACALSASAATQFIADSFETPEGTNGMSALYYKATVNELNQITAGVWTSGAGDVSKIVPADAANQNYAASERPLGGAVSNLVLNLETEGQTLRRAADSAHNFLTGEPVHVDTLVKFTPSEDNPVIDDINVKVAIEVNMAGNNFIRARIQ